MQTQAITLHAVKSLSIWGIVTVIALAVVALVLISTVIGRVVTIVIAAVLIVALWSQIHEVDHHYRACDNLDMSIVGVHYTVNPYCARS